MGGETATRASKVAVLNVVGLSRSVLGAHTPRLNVLVERGRMTTLVPDLPAVTCTSQASMLTGLPVSGHGIVGNGWYDREDAELKFWKQSNRLVHGEKVWETARKRDPGVGGFTVANLFWWFNMYSSANVSVTPRPQYRADGRKIPDCYSHPAGWRDELQAKLGQFPLFRFWGPMAGIESSSWIAEAAVLTDKKFDPTLSLVYLPHLDYSLQKFGPGSAEGEHAAGEIDAVVGDLVDHFEQRGAKVLVVSEYGIEPVNTPVHLNRALRKAGLITVREENGRELLDCGASEAFALADHQVAHVYCSGAECVERARAVLESEPGVDRVLDREAMRELEIDVGGHERSGELLVIAKSGHWFTYYYWEDDARAPDFARTVDIHRKPGYDPCELFVDPRIRFPKLTLGWKLLKKRVGMRALMDVIPLDASVVKGSHGRVDVAQEYRPVLIVPRGTARSGESGALPMRGVHDVILESLYGA